MLFRISILLVFTGTLCTCSRKIQSTFAKPEHLVVRSSVSRDIPDPGNNPCNDPLSYAPDPEHLSHTPPLAVHVVVHFMDAGDGVHNLRKVKAREFALDMISKCNIKLRANAKMHLPPGNDTPVLPVPWYYVLIPDPAIEGHDGIYFHYDTALYYYRHGRNTNRTSRAVIDKYAVQSDSVINIFMMPHHPDSVGRPDYRAVGTGIMLGSSLKIAQVFKESLIPESCTSLLNHEIGHALGLSHTWAGNDGCDDTPKHTNCWNYTSEPPCDSLVSNNLMDYNAWQAAVTPCQIGRVMRNVANPASRIRKYFRPDWCSYDSTSTITITDSVHWSAPKDLSGDIVIADHGVLQVSCRISLAQEARIIVAPLGRLILNDCQLHNACGDQWLGIQIQSRGKQHGIVEMFGDPRIEDVIHTVETHGIR